MSEAQSGPASSGFSRRDFVKTTAAVSTAALVSQLGLHTAYAQGSDVLKVGLIGCGGRGSGAAGDCLKGAEMAGAKAQIVACGDVFGNKLGGVKNSHKIPDDHCFAGIDAYQKVLASGVDMVILATPPGFRPYHVKAAIDAGKHVFFEKPVAVDPAGVRIVIEAGELAKTKGLAMVTGTQRRHEENYRGTIGAIHDGAIGDVLHMSVYWNGGGIWYRPRTPNQSDTEYQLNNWYHYVWLCGDQICEQHVHNLDVAHWVMDAPPVAAYGMGGRQVRDAQGQKPGQIWDHFAIEYEFASGGRVLSFCRHWPSADDNVSEFAIGSKGTANPGGWIQPKGGQRQSFKGGTSGYQQEHADLIKSIKDGKPLNEAKQVAESTMMAIMGRMSAYTGKRVTWDFVMNKSKLDTMPKNLDLKGALPEPPVPQPGTEKLI